MENVITLGKLIGLLFLFCPPSPLYFVFDNSKNTRNELARPVMGTIFLVVDVVMLMVLCMCVCFQTRLMVTGLRTVSEASVRSI